MATMAPAPTTTTTITPPRSSHGISDSWGFSDSHRDTFDLEPMSNHNDSYHGHTNGNSYQSSNELASRKMTSNDNLGGRQNQGSEKPGLDDPWTYKPRENDNKRSSMAISEGEPAPAEESKWIHRDKLARIESEELQAAGIYIPRSRAQSKQRRDRSRSAMRRGTDASENSTHRSRKDSMLESRPENIVNSWDIRTPEEIAEEEANAYFSKPSAKPGSRIPVPKISPAPATDPFDRGSRKATDSPEDNEPLTNTKTRSRSASMKGTDGTMGNLAAAKRSVTDISPKKPAARKTSGPKAATTGRPKTRSGSTKESNGSISTRPSTRSGELSTKAPEGDPPWMINSYKPDPRLPPDQQLLPTVARRLQQEKWEKEGKFGDVYDKEFRPLNDHVHLPPEDKPHLEDEPQEHPPEDEWPLKLEPSKSRAGSSYSTMPKIIDTKTTPVQSPLPSPKSPVRPQIPIAPPQQQVAPPPPKPTIERLPEPVEDDPKSGCGCCLVM